MHVTLLIFLFRSCFIYGPNCKVQVSVDKALQILKCWSAKLLHCRIFTLNFILMLPQLSATNTGTYTLVEWNLKMYTTICHIHNTIRQKIVSCKMAYIPHFRNTESRFAYHMCTLCAFNLMYYSNEFNLPNRLRPFRSNPNLLHTL